MSTSFHGVINSGTGSDLRDECCGITALQAEPGQRRAVDGCTLFDVKDTFCCGTTALQAEPGQRRAVDGCTFFDVKDTYCCGTTADGTGATTDLKVGVSINQREMSMSVFCVTWQHW